MSLFEQVLSAINEPTKQANPTQLSQIIDMVEQLSQIGDVDNQKRQVITSIVGKYVRSALKEKQQTQGIEEAETVIEKYSGISPNADAVNAVMTPQKQQQMAEEAATSTGINRDVIESMLPTLIPVVLQLLQTGATKVRNPGQVNNSVLQSFLDTDGDKDVDIADALSLAKRFLSN
ncbi:hypothetical protein VB715_03455 [Crocosphaera sp. UHCC 0190]|uniref:hypothetical protein n=1 Tax=Crocosphaera sp. UHCC 0190 TaxID=3110246 RepID=UPI002B20962A|nr:hypothetical protein [Crocosphaera sp. UHCC 0190]MEA5508811.1 hypothetical protein [Crocosphaera sp. UHCC 0190]